MNNLSYFIFYIIIINIIGFFTMFYDKKKAILHQNRVAEKSIFIIASIGGALGVYIGMYTFRHKTKHLKFTVLIPILFIINLMCMYFIIINII